MLCCAVPDVTSQDRYYGINDPVANKMMRRMGEQPKLEPPEDQ
jgi:pre-mRNA-splicing factor RBM22/SLT11